LKLGLPLEPPLILFNASAQPTHKRLDLATSAVEIAKQTLKSIHLVVLDGLADPADIPYYMNACDCLLLASDAEGSPNVVKEALACNLPVVSVDVGDVRERLRGVSPSIIVSRDPKEIGFELVELLRSRPRSNGRSKVLTLSLEHVAQKIHGVYEEMMFPCRLSPLTRS
jgi:glycosyltransferase involved in cell wall biosynthesis